MTKPDQALEQAIVAAGATTAPRITLSTSMALPSVLQRWTKASDWTPAVPSFANPDDVAAWYWLNPDRHGQQAEMIARMWPQFADAIEQAKAIVKRQRRERQHIERRETAPLAV